jgi:superfamily I DNA and/or RNA helicase
VSRAKRQFVLVCDTATLGKNTTFGSLINYIKQKGLVLNMRGMNVDVD